MSLLRSRRKTLRIVALRSVSLGENRPSYGGRMIHGFSRRGAPGEFWLVVILSWRQFERSSIGRRKASQKHSWFSEKPVSARLRSSNTG